MTWLTCHAVLYETSIARRSWLAETWRDEEDRDEVIDPLANRPLTAAEADAVFSGDFAFARAHFEALGAEGARAITAQDRAIHAMCRPERLLDLIRRFTVFDGGARKVARHQQFFGISRFADPLHDSPHWRHSRGRLAPLADGDAGQAERIDEPSPGVGLRFRRHGHELHR